MQPQKSPIIISNEFREGTFSSQPSYINAVAGGLPFAMLKRKRENNAKAPEGGGGDAVGQRKGEVEEKLVHGKKMLNRALKTAKGFEWQKLVKRIGNAKAEGADAEGEVARLERELKGLKVGLLAPV